MAIYQERLKRVEAMQVTAETLDEVRDWCGGTVRADGTLLYPAGLNTWAPAQVGTYLMRLTPEAYASAPADDFERDWEPATEGDA